MQTITIRNQQFIKESLTEDDSLDLTKCDTCNIILPGFLLYSVCPNCVLENDNREDCGTMGKYYLEIKDMLDSLNWYSQEVSTQLDELIAEKCNTTCSNCDNKDRHNETRCYQCKSGSLFSFMVSK